MNNEQLAKSKQSAAENGGRDAARPPARGCDALRSARSSVSLSKDFYVICLIVPLASSLLVGRMHESIEARIRDCRHFPALAESAIDASTKDRITRRGCEALQAVN